MTHLNNAERRLDPDVRLVTTTHVGTHRGVVNPVAEVGVRTRRAGVPFFLDACQSAGQLPVDLRRSAATWRPGPVGTGLCDVGAQVHDGTTRRCGIVTFTLADHEPAAIQSSAAAAGINVSVTSAPMARLDMESRGLISAVLASPHAYNTEHELELLVEHLRSLRRDRGVVASD